MKKYFIIIFSFCLFFGQNNIERTEISGFIFDKNTGEILIGANVFIKNTDYGTSTDINGYYALVNIPYDVNSILVFSLY